jgi:hypothetical protein
MVMASVSTFQDHKATLAAPVAARRCFSSQTGMDISLGDIELTPCCGPLTPASSRFATRSARIIGPVIAARTSAAYRGRRWSDGCGRFPTASDDRVVRAVLLSIPKPRPVGRSLNRSIASFSFCWPNHARHVGAGGALVCDQPILLLEGRHRGHFPQGVLTPRACKVALSS